MFTALRATMRFTIPLYYTFICILCILYILLLLYYSTPSSLPQITIEYLLYKWVFICGFTPDINSLITHNNIIRFGWIVSGYKYCIYKLLYRVRSDQTFSIVSTAVYCVVTCETAVKGFCTNVGKVLLE